MQRPKIQYARAKVKSSKRWAGLPPPDPNGAVVTEIFRTKVSANDAPLEFPPPGLKRRN
jgi:hypothetical protein